MESIDLQYLPIKLGELDAFVFMMKVKDLYLALKPHFEN